MKHFLLAIFFLFLTQFSQAQELRIVKDNINCSYGLKDKIGNWVIDPIYILIQEYNSGYFLVKDALGDGLLTPDGKWLVECKYDRFDFKIAGWTLMYGYNTQRIPPTSLESFFLVGIKGDRKSLLNSRGKEILEMSENASCEMDDGEHFLIIESAPTRTTYIDTSGRVLIDEKLGAMVFFREKEYSLHGDRLENYGQLVAGNVQLIDRTGKPLLNEKFDRAMITTRNRICFERNSNYGVISTDGTVIIAPKYKRELRLGPPHAHKEGWAILDSLGRKGVMKSDGVVLLEPKYEEVTPVYGLHRVQKAWMLKSDDKLGIIDTKGKWLVPLKYDQLFTFFALRKGRRDFNLNFIVTLNGKSGYIIPEKSNEPSMFYDLIEPVMSHDYNYSQSIGRALITKQNGKFGLLDIDGTIKVPCIYANHAKRGSSSDNQFFFRDRELREFAFKNNRIEERIWKPFIEVENEIIFTDGNTYLSALLVNGGTEIGSIDTRNKYNQLYGNMFVVNRDSKGDLNIYNHLTSKRINLDGIDEIWVSRNNRFLIRTKSNKQGVLNENGKMIVDTLYNNIQMNYRSNYIWASKLNNESMYKWVLLDSNGVQKLKTEFDTHFEANSGDKLISQGNRTGLMNTNTFTWNIKPIHPCLYKMIDEFYAVITLEGKKGITRSNGSYLLQPIYDSIILLSANTYYGGDFQEGVEPEIRWLVRSGSTEFLVDQNGKQITSKTDVRFFKESLLFDDTVLLEQANQTRNFPILDYSPSLHFLRGLTMEQIRAKRKALWVNPKIKTAVFDSIYSDWERNKKPCNQPNRFTFYSTEQKSDKEQKVKEMCNCSQGFGWQSGQTVSHQLISIGNKFATASRDYHYNYNDPFGQHMAMSQAPPAPPASQYWNFIERGGKVEAINLNDIFPSNSVLMEEFVIALKKRDDLELECSSLETMLEMINGKFSLTEDGIHLFMDQNHRNFYGAYSPIMLLIPLENLKSHKESSWIVPLLEK